MSLVFCPRPLRPSRASAAALLAGLLLLPAARALADGAAAEEVPIEGLAGELRLTGMTFVGSRGDVTQFVLNARTAVIRPETNIAELEDVRVRGTEAGEAEEFEVRCDRGELDVDTNDFLAEGDVRGVTADGRRYAAAWVRYDHAQSLLYTDAPATMQDSTGSFRGDGFRYHLEDGRFRLTGNVKVVQQ
jgi:LPS export ABC transporter protein LptC